MWPSNCGSKNEHELKIVYRSEEYKHEYENKPENAEVEANMAKTYFNRLEHFIKTPCVLFFHDTV